MMNRASVHVSKLGSSRLALRVGFGGLMLLMALSGFDALNVLGQFRSADDRIRSQYLAKNRVLNSIRSELYLSGTYVRDFLLDPDSQRATAFGVSLENVRLQMDADLESYTAQLEPEQADAYGALRRELTGY